MTHARARKTTPSRRRVARPFTLTSHAHCARGSGLNGTPSASAYCRSSDS
jgi:hypothetical protein